MPLAGIILFWIIGFKSSGVKHDVERIAGDNGLAVDSFLQLLPKTITENSIKTIDIGANWV